MAVGTVDAPVIFTSLRDDTVGGDSNFSDGTVSPARGDWNDVYLNSPASRLENVVMRWGGSSNGSSASMHVYNSSPTIRGCEISSSTYDGIRLSGSVTPVIQNSYIHDNTRYGVNSVDASAGPVSLNGNTFQNNNGWGAYLNTVSDISSNTFNGNANGLYVSTGTGTGVIGFSSNTFLNQSGHMVMLNMNAYPYGSGNVIGSGNRYAGIALGANTWTLSGTLGRVGDVPYLIRSGSMGFSANRELTIAPGVVIKFSADSLGVNGTLTAVGTAEAPIVFTSLRDDTVGGDSNLADGSVSPARGDWNDIYLTNSNSRLENVQIRWGGSSNGSSASMHVYNSSPTIRGCEISSSTYDGIKLSGTVTPVIQNSYIHDNTRYGVNSLDALAGPVSLTGNTFQKNSSWGAYLNTVSDISSNTFNGNANGLYVSTGTGTGVIGFSSNTFLNQNGHMVMLNMNAYPYGSGNVIGNGNKYAGIALGANTWTLSGTLSRIDDIPYLIRSGSMGFSANRELTIAPGVVIKFSADSLGVNGTLTAVGTSEAPIVFTSLRDDTVGGDSNLADGSVSPARGDWNDIYLTNSNSRLENVQIRWGGSSNGSSASMHVYNSSPTIRGCEISSSTYDGIKLSGTNTPAIQNSYIHDNTRYGVNSVDALAGPVSLNGNTFQNNNSWGAYLNTVVDISSNIFNGNANGLYVSTGTGTGVIGFSSNTFLNQSGHMVMLNMNAYPYGSGNVIGSGNKYAGISLGGNTWTLSGTFSRIDDIPYLIRSGNMGFSANRELTIAPGVVVKLRSNSLGVSGTLTAVGTAEAPIVFTSLRDDTVGGDSNLADGSVSPARGDWNDLYLTNSNSRLENVIMRWGGSSNGSSAILHIYNSTPTIKYSQIRLSNNYGIITNGTSAKPLILGSLITQNPYGVYANTGSLPELHGCNIQGNTYYGVYNTGTGVLNASNNYWGNASGPKDTSNNASDPTGLYNPSGTGDQVSDYVNYSNYVSTVVAYMQPAVISTTLLNTSPAKPGTRVGVSVTFNEDMNTGLAPQITYGLSSPFDTYSLTGGTWTAANVYQVYATLPSLADGNYTMRISGAQDYTQATIAAIDKPFYAVDGTAPAAPSAFAAQSLNGGKVGLSWTAPSDEAPASYRVYRETAEFTAVSGLTPVQSGITAASFTDLPAADGIYYYAVTAVDAAGNESAPSAVVSAASVRTPPAVPLNFNAVFQPVSKNVALTWEGPGGSAAYYNLYRATYPAVAVANASRVVSSATALSAADAPAADGNYYYLVTSLDALGNESGAAVSGTVAFDVHAPVLSIGGFTDGKHYNHDITVTISAADFSPVFSTITLNGLVMDSSFTVSATGQYNLNVEASDVFGFSTATARSFVIDLTAPQLSITYPLQGQATNQNITLTYASTDDFTTAGQLVFRDDQGRSPPFTYTTEGVKTATVTVTDLAGNIASAAVTFTLDKTAPAAVSDLRFASYLPASGKVDLAWTAPADTLSGSSLYTIKAATYPLTAANFAAAPLLMDGIQAQAAGSAEEFSIPVSTAQTLYFALKTSDLAGNLSAISNTLVMDVQPPVISTLSPSATGYITRPVTVALGVADDIALASVTFTLDGSPVASMAAAPYAFKWNTIAYADGEHVLAATAYDTAGNSSTLTRTYTLQYQTPPTPVVYYPYSGFATAVSTFSVYGSAEPGTTVNVRISSVVYISTPAASDGSYNALITLAAEGDYTLALFASDARGAGTASQALSISYNYTAPNAPASLSATGLAGGRVRLNWSAPSGKAPAYYRIYRSTAEDALAAGAAAVPGLLVSTSSAVTYYDKPAADGIYYYAVTARDAAGNESVLSDIGYALSDGQSPTAAVTLPYAVPPLGVGAYLLNVTVSEVLTSAPYFTFTPAGGSPALITLEASDTTNVWVGTLTVTQAMASGTGRFAFQGADLNGNSGQSITSGVSLVLETAGPVATAAFSASAWPVLKSGEYTITLNLDEPPAAMPQLAYTNQASTRTIALSSAAAGTMWQAGIIVSTETGDGTYNLVYSAKDLLGNSGTLLKGSTYFIVDTVAPGAPRALNWSGAAAGKVILTWSGALGESAAAYCIYRAGTKLVCQPAAGGGETYSDTPAADGYYDYSVSAVDKAGNESAAASVSAYSDATPPAAPAALAAAAASESGIVVSWTAGAGDAPAGFRLYRSTSPIISTAGMAYRTLVGTQYTDQPAGDGVYYYGLTAVDAVGNESAITAAQPADYDKAAPLITITGVTAGGLYNGAVYPVFSASDLNLDTASLAAVLDGAAFAAGSAVSTPGAHTLTVSASDISLHYSSKTVAFAIDTTSPAITISGIADGGYYTAAVSPVYSAADENISSVGATLNGAAFVSGSTISANAAYTLAVTAADRAGNVSVATVTFTVDLPPQKAQNLAAIIEDGSMLTLTWTSPGSSVAVFKVYRDGAYLGPVATDQNYYKDASFSAGTAHVYEVLAVDAKGRDGDRATAVIPAVSMSLASYGSVVSESQALNRGFFDAVHVSVVNASTYTVNAGPLTLSAAGLNGVAASAVAMASGATVDLAPVVYTSTASAAIVNVKAVLALPRGGDAAVSSVINFNLAVRDPRTPILELVPDSLVRGAYSNVRVKFTNRGSAPADVVTARKINGTVSASDVVTLQLATLSGLVAAQGALTQTDADMVTSGGNITYFVRVPAGGSYTFAPVSLAVPVAADTVTVSGSLSGFAYSLNYNPLYSGLKATASKDVITESSLSYLATISPERPVYDQGNPVKLSGRITDLQGNAISSFPVVISILNDGYTRTLSTATGVDGNYNAVFTPAYSEAGVYDISVRHPDSIGAAASSSFTIVGFGLNYSNYSVSMRQGSNYSFDVTLNNTGGAALNGLAYSLQTVASDGVTVTVPLNLSSTLAAGAQMKIPVTCSATENATGGTFTLKVAEANGFTRSMPVTVTAVAAKVVPQITPQLFSMGIVAGDSKTQTITVYNVGYATWTNVNVTKPTLDWVAVDGMAGAVKSLGNIAPGGNVSFTLKVAPPAGQASSAYAQNPLVTITSDNYDTLPVNAAITVTSAKAANVYFNVANADKLATDATRFISGAAIRLTSQDVAGLSATATTDANGYAALAAVPSGNYIYTVSASGAQSVSESIVIEPGVDQTLSVLLPTSMVTYTWSVTPTTITDTYDVALDVTLKTDVPAPAVVVSPTVVSQEMTDGQTVYTQFTLKNSGLISVFDVELTPTTGDDAIQIELQFTTIAELKPGETVTVPVKVHLVHASCHEALIKLAGKYLCAAGIWTTLPMETIKVIVGDCLGGGSSNSSSSGSNSNSTIGGSGSNNTTTSYGGVGGAFVTSVVNNVQTKLGCKKIAKSIKINKNQAFPVDGSPESISVTIDPPDADVDLKWDTPSAGSISGSGVFTPPSSPSNVTIAVTDAVSDKGDSVQIPVFSLQVDPHYSGVNDGDSAQFSVAVQPENVPVTAWSWSWSLPQSNVGNSPNCEFSPNNAQTTTVENSKWYAYPKENCSVSATAVYDIDTQVIIAGKTYNAKPGSLNVNVPWDPGGVAPWPKVIGQPAYSASIENGVTTWCVSDATGLSRQVADQVCYDGGPSPCVKIDVPKSSQFYNKTLVHEMVHVQDYKTGLAKDYWSVTGFFATLSGYCDKSLDNLKVRVANALDAYNNEQGTKFVEEADADMEDHAYSVSEDLPPTYLYRRCP